MVDSIADPKLVGDYVEALINGWCPHEGTKGTQALKCLRCIGDALAEVQGQARAEVLAACVQMSKDWLRITIQQFTQKYKIDTDDFPTALATLQPTASALEEHDRQLQIETYAGARKLWEKDLEELLREAELRGLKFVADALYAKNNPFSWANKLNGRIAELEKARALVEGKKK